MGKRVAIVGSGCSGLAALWALNISTDHEVYLFEAASRLGGHTNTVTYEGPDGSTVEVDTGFIVMNTATSPNVIAFLKELGVPTKKTQMTFGVSRDQGTFEWAGTSLSSIFAQKGNIFNPGMWRLIFDVIRFHESAVDLLTDEQETENSVGDEQRSRSTPGRESIAEYLDREGYSPEFRQDYLIPKLSAIWSTSPDECATEISVDILFRFIYSHHLLSTVSKQPDWLTIPGGSEQYIDAVMKDVPPERIHLNCKITAVAPTEAGAVRLTANGQNQEFDHVILAIHGEQALQILRPVATKQEHEILSGFRTSRNVAVLHSDVALMPKNRKAWSSWNYITESPFPPKRSRSISKVCLTCWMNSLQHIAESKFGQVLVTLNPLKMPDPRLAQGIWEYSHPQYNTMANKSQRLLPRIQNTRGISYCGAWTRYGLHEDGISSGFSVAMNHLGAQLPFPFMDPRSRCGRKAALTIKGHFLRLLVLVVQIWVLLAEIGWHTLTTAVDRQLALRRKIE